jgi:hypothetical protein
LTNQVEAIHELRGELRDVDRVTRAKKPPPEDTRVAIWYLWEDSVSNTAMYNIRRLNGVGVASRSRLFLSLPTADFITFCNSSAIPSLRRLPTHYRGGPGKGVKGGLFN